MSKIRAMPNAALKQDEKVVTLQGLHRRAAVAPASFNKENRTVTVEYTTGATARMFDWFIGEFLEELATGPENVRIERLNAGAPFLNCHNSRDIADVVGVVENADQTHAQVRFDTDPISDEVFRKVENKILRFVSVGYVVHKYIEVTKPGDEIRTLRAVDWEPYEISVVPIPADAGAGIRAGDLQTSCTILAHRAPDEKKGHQMTVKNTNKPAIIQRTADDAVDPAKTTTTTTETTTETVVEPVADPAAPQTGGDANQRAMQQGIAMENERQVQIRGALDKAKITDAAFAATLMKPEVTLEKARGLIIDKLAGDDNPAPTNNQVRSHMNGQNELDTRNAAIADALLHRSAPGKFKLENKAREYRGMTMMEMARDALEFRDPGCTRGMNKMEIARRALMSTSDLPEIMSSVTGRTLRQSYEATPRTFQAFCRQAVLPDFREVSRLSLSSGPNLDLVKEGEEYNHGSFSDAAERYKILTYGKILGFTREMLVNDDLNALTRLPQMMGAAAARKESDLVYAILNANPNMADGVPLFHATHGNIFNAAMDVAGIGTMRGAMRVQTDPSGLDSLNLEGKYLIVPAARETAVAQFLAPIQAATVGNVNPYNNSYQPIIESRLDKVSTSNFFMAADPDTIDTIEYAYLEGNEPGPYIEMHENFDRDGVQWKIRHDFGAKAIDWRGLSKSTN